MIKGVLFLVFPWCVGMFGFKVVMGGVKDYYIYEEFVF